jgi:carbamoyltransferase
MIVASMYPCPFNMEEIHDQNSTIIFNENFFSYEEEKLTSIKEESTVRFPERSLMMGMKELNLYPEQIDFWVFTKPPKVNLEEMYYFFTNIVKAFNGNRIEFKKWYKNKVKFLDHQISHASLATYGSGFEKCAFLCLDGGGDPGDQRNFIFGEFVNNKFKIFRSNKGLKNIGAFHSFIADSLGFAGNENGKVSGLAGYGNIIPELEIELKKLIKIGNNGIVFNRKRFNPTKVRLSKIRAKEYSRLKIFNTFPSDTNIFQISSKYLPQDIAATGEKVFQESVLKLIQLLKKETKLKKIVFSGGIFQNVSLNNLILKSEIFEEVYFPMASGDNGQSLGTALYFKNQYKKSLKNKEITPLLGPSFSDFEIEDLLKKSRINYVKEKNIEKKVAKLISENNTIGWFQARGEYGKRSLGARSILGDPRKLESKSRINQLLKKRDWFMPYAPSVLEEYLSDYVKFPKKSAYMQIAFDVKKDKKNDICSAVHVDGTARIHTVKKSVNPKYWNLINEFRLITGIPIILNTSFNRHHIPTISEPRQAIEHLLDGCMDYLAIGNFLVSFKDNRIADEPFRKEESEEYSLKKDCIIRLSNLLEHEKNMENVIEYVQRLAKFLQIRLSYDGKKFRLENKVVLENKIEEKLLKELVINYKKH